MRDQPGPGGDATAISRRRPRRRLPGRPVRPHPPRHPRPSRADVEAVQAAFDLTRITVAAETARAYADACSAGRQLDVARESVRIQEQTFDLTRRLFEGGRGTALDTSQAGSLLEQTRAAHPDAGGAAADGAVPPVGADRPAAGRIPARGRGLRARRRLWPSRSRSATAPRCSPAGRTSATPSASWPRRRRGSASRPPSSIRTSASAARSASTADVARRARLRATASASASGR